MPPAIRVIGLEKKFGSKEVLRGIDLEVSAGESLVILGGSGSGKSVLIKHLIGLLSPDRGRVEVDGVDLSTLDRKSMTHFRRRFGMAFQEGALFDSMTVGENVAFPLSRAGMYSPHEIHQRVEECLTSVKLEGVAEKAPSELSGGMRRRVGFARAIALKPKILLFDEPNTGLDPILSATIDELILGLGAELGCTTITITHDLVSAYRIADRIAMLHQGKIHAVAEPETFRQLTDPAVREFIYARVLP